jgi:protein gp37
VAENSAIEWTHHTFNHVRGCTKVSDGCKNCYAETLSGRNPKTLGEWGPKGKRVIASESYWKEPLRWNKEAEQAGERRRVFCATLADVFEGPETMPADSLEDVERARHRLFRLIVDTPHLDWLLLTKRPENFRTLAPMNWQDECPSNVWIGTSVENQQAADERIPHLLNVPAKVRFLSCEPLLGPVEFSNVTNRSDCVSVLGKPAMEGIHWVICGGESGPKARPMHMQWARSLRDQCQAAGVAFHFKQWGEWVPTVQAMEVCNQGGWKFYSPPGDCVMMKVGKKAAGRMLDGRTWDEFPEVAHE